MRTARTKMKGSACYYHACSRITGAKDEYLFTDVDIDKKWRADVLGRRVQATVQQQSRTIALQRYHPRRDMPDYFFEFSRIVGL